MEIDEILSKVLIDKEELTPSQKRYFKMWLKSAKNQALYAQLVVATKPINVSKQEVWKNIEGQIRKGTRKGSRRHARLLFKVAAVITLLFTSYYSTRYFIIAKSKPAGESVIVEKISLPGQKINTILPDGTIVKLNAGSKLVAPQSFTGDTREVRLIGEAFFDVERNESKPFIIHTEALDVTVLGTSFNVSAYHSLPTAVSVRTGKVEVKKTNGANGIELHPSEMAVLPSNGNLTKRLIKNDEKIFGWIDQKMVFNEESLPNVFLTIERWYGVKFYISSEIVSSKKYSASYQNPTLKEVLESLSHVYDFKYELDEKRIIVK